MKWRGDNERRKVLCVYPCMLPHASLAVWLAGWVCLGEEFFFWDCKASFKQSPLTTIELALLLAWLLLASCIFLLGNILRNSVAAFHGIWHRIERKRAQSYTTAHHLAGWETESVWLASWWMFGYEPSAIYCREQWSSRLGSPSWEGSFFLSAEAPLNRLCSRSGLEPVDVLTLELTATDWSI